MIGAIDMLRRAGKTLEPLEIEELGGVEAFIADHELLDPDRPEELFEPMGRHGLAQSWARGREMIEARLHRR